MRKNVAGQTIGAQMTDLDNNAFTGLVKVYVTGNGGTQAIGATSSGDCTHEGNGYHSYTPSQAETNYDHIAFTFVGTGACPQTIQVRTAVDVGNVLTGGIVAGSFASGALDAVWSVSTRTLTALGATPLAEMWDYLLTSITTAGSIGRLIKDNLTVATSTLATQTNLTAISNTMLLYPTCPAFAERPDTGTRLYYIDLYTSSFANAQVTPAAISVAAVNSAGTSRNARLSSTTPSTVNTGHYRVVYTSTNTDDPFEQIIFTFSVTHPTNGNVTKAGCVMTIVDSKMSAAYKTIIDNINTNSARLTLDRASYLDQIPDIEEDTSTTVDAVNSLSTRVPDALTANGFIKASVEGIQNDSASAGDLKDMVDTAYDPTNNVIQSDVRRVDGVTLVTHASGTVPTDLTQRTYKGVVANAITGTTFDITPPSSGQDDMFNEQMLVITNAAGFRQARTITDYVQSTGVITFDAALNISWAAGAVVEIYAIPYKHKINSDKIDTVNTALTNIQGTSFTTGTDSLRQISQRNVYAADINLIRDSTTDEWTVQWFKNDSPVTSGITSPTIRIIKRSDGTNLLAATAMTEVGSTGAYKYDGTSTNRLTVGDNYIIEVVATIDTASRTWRKVIGRDDI